MARSNKVLNTAAKMTFQSLLYFQRKVTVVLMMALFAAFLSACKKLIEIDPPIQYIVGEEIYNTNGDAASVLSGIYSNMSNNGTNGVFSGTKGISLRTGLSGDELVSTASESSILTILYTNALVKTTNSTRLFWEDFYAYIFKANSAIEGISASNRISPVVKQQLLGEAKFVRAFMYFYLINLYGDVPLLLRTDIKYNSTAARTEKSKVYDQIIKDLLDARDGLSDNYVSADAVTPTIERVRPNKAVASALLARVYLYTEQWELAESEASKIITNVGVYQLESLDGVFLKSNKEAIWQLQPVNAVTPNTLDAAAFVLKIGGVSPGGTNGSSRPTYLSSQLIKSFELGDKRKDNWIDSVTIDGKVYPFAYKYKAWLSTDPVSEYLVVLRLGEQYLIRAEARLRQGKLTGVHSASEDINTVRFRAGLSPTVASNIEELLSVILHERQVELFTEFGHRWLDLKRSQLINQVMNTVAPLKGGSWENYKALYPIPIQDIIRNPSLKGHQNIGYPEQ